MFRPSQISFAAALVVLVASTALAVGPPCMPCAALSSADPLELIELIDSEPRLEEEQRLYLSWRVGLGGPVAAATADAAAAIEKSGARPWMKLVFDAGAPIGEHLDDFEIQVGEAVALAAAAPKNGHFQVAWEPSVGVATAADLAFILKRVSVALVGAQASARVLFGPLEADVDALRELYAEDVGAYLDGVVLAPAPVEHLRLAAEALGELDPGRPLIVDGTRIGVPANTVLARAAEHASIGIAMTFFAGDDEVGALSALKVLARELSGEVAYDPYSEPQGNASAWGFVRAEDLSLRLIAEVPSDTERLFLSLSEPSLLAPRRLDLQSGVGESIIARRGDGKFTMEVGSPNPVEMLAVERPSAASMGGFEERLDIAGERQMPVAEILRRLQAFDDAQERRLATYEAINTEYLRFSVPSGPSIELTREGDFFFERDHGFDWAWQRVFVGGVRWKGSFPEFPIIQPEKAAAMPLEITLHTQYDYRLRGTNVVDGRDCWVVEFRPSGEVAEEALWRGTIWVDREHYARVKLRASQIGLVGDVLSNEETLFYSPLDENGQVTDWSASAFVLPIRRLGNELQKIVDATVQVEKEQVLSKLHFNEAGFEDRRAAVWASEATMVRDTDEGLRYLEAMEDGSREVKTNFNFSAWSLLGGTYYDDSLDYPLPLAGVNFLTRDLAGTGAQANLFFAGVIVDGLIADPDLFGSRFSGGAEVFGLFVPFEQQQYRDGEEVVAESVDQQRAKFELSIGHPLGKWIQLDLGYEIGFERYSEAEDADPSFVLPSDTVVQSLKAKLTLSRGGYQLALRGQQRQRDEWLPWGLPGSTEWSPEHEDFVTYQIRAKKTFRLKRFTDLEVELEYLGGEDLDRFSKYGFGFYGDSQVAGYQSGLITASQAQGLHLEYGISLAEVIRVELQADAVWATDVDSGLDRELLGGIALSGNVIGPWKTLVRFSVGVPVAGPGDGITAQIFFLKILK